MQAIESFEESKLWLVLYRRYREAFGACECDFAGYDRVPRYLAP